MTRFHEQKIQQALKDLCPKNFALVNVQVLKQVRGKRDHYLHLLPYRRGWRVASDLVHGR
jgi:hypothetical protein